MGRRPLLKLAAVAAAGLAAWLLYPLLLSDEARIRRQIDASLDAFNRARAGSCVSVLAEDFRDETHRADRRAIRGYLAALFISSQNRVDGRFRYAVRLLEDELRIAVREDGSGRADVTGALAFRDLLSESEEPAWEAAVTALFAKESGDWLVKTASFETRSGRRPF